MANGYPVVALDVDGVLMPWLKPGYGPWLLSLAGRAELVWASSWEHSANFQVGPRIGLPELPVIEFPAAVKLRAVAGWCGSRPLAWLDDFHPEAHRSWSVARTRDGVPTLLVLVDPAEGLKPAHVGSVSAWLDGLS